MFMRVVCIDDRKRGEYKDSHLTLNKIYLVIESVYLLGESQYKIQNDKLEIEYYLALRFKTIEDIRDEKINNILFL